MGRQIQSISRQELGQAGFPTITERLVDTIDSTQLAQILELLGRAIHDSVDIAIAGSIPTLITSLTARPTADIHFVDEVPAEIRRQRAILRKIRSQFGLTLGHVQSHYLPAGWMNRRRWLGEFGGLRVYLVDEFDIFVSKLSSKKEKHQLDLRVLALKLDRHKARHRLLTDGKAFLDNPALRPQIEENWRFIFREPLLPADSDQRTGETVQGDPSPKDTSHGRTARSARKKRDSS